LKSSTQFAAVCYVVLICAVAAVPACAETLYDNSTSTSYQSTGWGFQPPLEIADSFTLTAASNLSQISFGNWIAAGDTLSSVDWAITTGAFSGSTLASGTATTFSTTLENASPSLDGWTVCSDLFSIPALSLSAGTYYLQLDNAVESADYSTFWDLSNGPSSGWGYNTAFPGAYSLSGAYGSGSQTFAIYGTSSAARTVTPEPSSFLLLGSGLAGLAGFIKRKMMA